MLSIKGVMLARIFKINISQNIKLKCPLGQFSLAQSHVSPLLSLILPCKVPWLYMNIHTYLYRHPLFLRIQAKLVHDVD